MIKWTDEVYFFIHIRLSGVLCILFPSSHMESMHRSLTFFKCANLSSLRHT